MPLPLLRLPPLDLLRGFVAVGRRLSITQAAEELCITQSAMSKQIRALEDLLGVRLLHRRHRSLSFTEEGQRLFVAANAALQQLQDALGSLAAPKRRPVTITASTGVAGLWLLPRLGDFQQQHPGIDVRIAASNAVVADLAAEQIDLALRYCSRAQAPQGALRLFGETVVPVASPALGRHRLERARDLAGLVLLEFDHAQRPPWLQWAQWLAERGLDATQARGMLRFNQYDQVILAALAGQGVALGRRELLAPMLADGRLRALGAAATGSPGSHAIWLLQAESAPRSDVQHVVDWIVASARPLA